MSVKRSCGDMHAGAYVGYDSSCYGCREANGLPSIEQMEADFAALEAKAARLAEALELVAANGDGKVLSRSDCQAAIATAALAEWKKP